jgi:hypothetical protein
MRETTRKDSKRNHIIPIDAMTLLLPTLGPNSPRPFFLFFLSTFSYLQLIHYYFSLLVIDLIDYYDHQRTQSFSGQL